MITLVNYGLGNIQAFANIYKNLNIPVAIASNAEQLQEAERLILPGVGAFDWAMARLEASGMRPVLDELVLQRRCPVLGICVGMQMMAQRSDEGQHPGLGWIEADVKRFDESTFTQQTHLPHMGWNQVEPVRSDALFPGLESDARFYFLHSYYFVPHHSEDTLATTDYNGVYTSAVRHDNIYGTQFHPEKSHHWGIRLLHNFAKL